MPRSFSMRARAASVFLLSASLLLAACSGHGRPDQPSSQLSFGVDMARRGLWDEALFRFYEAEKLDPQNPHIQSNLGVAYEASGQFDKALECYKKALSLAPNDKDIRTNYARFVEFYQSFKGDKTAKADGKEKAGAAKPGAPAGQPGNAVPPAEPPVPPSTPEDVPPPPADNQPPR